LRDSKVTAVECVGVNLWDEQYMEGYYSPSEGYHIRSSAEICTANKIAVKAGKQYRMTIGNLQSQISLMYYDKNGVFLSYKQVGNSHIITPPTNAAYIHLNFGKEYGNVYNNDIMLNKGETALPYSPYFRNTFPIPEVVQNMDGYGQGVNADYCNKIVLDPAEGVKKFEKRTKRMVFDGTEGFSRQGTKQFGIGVSDMEKSAYTIENAGCTHFDYVTQTYGNHITGFVTHNGLLLFRYTELAEDTLEAWKAYLAEQYANGTPVTVEYALATPTETDISEYFTDDNLIGVEAYGEVTAVNEHKQAVPFSIEYTVKGV
jgi:hypothetical protein